MSCSTKRPATARNIIQRPDGLAAHAHRDRLHRAKPHLYGHRRERRPTTGIGREVLAEHRRAAAVALKAWPLLILGLQQVQRVGALAGGGHHSQHAGGVGKQQPGLGAVQQLHAALRQTVQKLDHVEVLDHRVGQLDEGPHNSLLSCHDLISISISLAPGGEAAIMKQRCSRWRVTPAPRSAGGA
jgi:hypothetical protein